MKWKANSEVVAQRLDDSMVLINLATDRIVELNETAAAMFEILGTPADELDLSRQLAERYEVDPEQLRMEISDTLSSLEAERLVERLES